MSPSSSSKSVSPASGPGASSTCDLNVTLRLGGGESLVFDGKGDARRDGGRDKGLEEGVLMVGVGVLEGYLASDVANEGSNLLSLDIHASQTWRSAIAKGMDRVDLF